MPEPTPRFEDHTGLIGYVMRKHGYSECRGALDREDLWQAGALGLMRAIERFDPERGVRFSVYACWWIRQGIVRELQNHAATVRLPCYLQQARRRAGLKQRARVRSLDAPLRNSDDGEGTLHDVIGAPDPEPAPDLEPLLDVLDPRSRRVVSLRLREVTLREIGEQEGISRERVRQVETQALATMRAACRSRYAFHA